MTHGQQVVEKDQFARLLGMELLEMAPGFAKVRMTLTERHVNGLGTAHGGAIFALADFAFAAAANAYESIAMAIHCDISYVKAVDQGTLIAEAQELSRTSKLGTYSVRIHTIDGELIALFQGMAYRKKKNS